MTGCDPACTQVASRTNAEADATVRLGALGSGLQAQLENFKVKALKAGVKKQRNLYVTEWRAFDVKASGSSSMLVIGDESPNDSRSSLKSRVEADSLAEELQRGKWPAVAVAVATQVGVTARDSLVALEVALTVVKTQASLALAPIVWFMTTGAQTARVPQYAGVWGFARSVRIEEPSLSLQCVDGDVRTSLTRELPQAEPEIVLAKESGQGGHLVPRLTHASIGANADTTSVAASHVITGGTGSLGLLTARWLAQRGAVALTLVSRGGTLAPDMTKEWAQLKATEAATQLMRCDAAEVTQVRRVAAFTQAPRGSKGLWHAAGTLADSTLARQTASSLSRVYAPKAHGAWNLQCALASTPLSACVLFSSVAAVIGLAGQTNYSAANSCLDALASFRRSRSQSAVSMQWGA